MVGDLIQSWYLILGMFSAPPCLASMKCVMPLYIIPSLPLSFRAFRSFSLMNLRYVFFNENASIPNMLCGSWVTMFGVHLSRPHIFSGLQLSFCRVLLWPEESMVLHKSYMQSLP